MIFAQAMAHLPVLGYHASECCGGDVPAISKLTEEQWDYARALDAAGVPRTEIARRVEATFGVRITRAGLSRTLGPKERGGPSQGSRAIRIMLNDQELNELRQIAANFGYVGTIGKTAGVGSMSELLRAIARGEVVVRRR